MEFEPLFLEIEHKIGKLEKMAQRFTGATESVDEFQRRIEKESKQQQSINRALFDLKRKQDQEAERIRRGLSPQQAQLEAKKEREAKRAQRKLFQQKTGDLNRFHDEQMKYLNNEYALNKKRGSIELDEEIQEHRHNRRSTMHDQHRDTDDDDDDQKSDVSDLSTNSSTNSTNTKEARQLETRDALKKQKTLNRIKQRKDIRTEQEERVAAERKWCRRHCGFLYNADDLEFIFTKNFKLTVSDFDKMYRIEKNPLAHVEFIGELNRDVLSEPEKDQRGHVRINQSHITLSRKSRNSIGQHHRRQTSSLLYSQSNIEVESMTEEAAENEQEMGVFHIRYNGVCTFTAYDSKLHRDKTEKMKLKHDVINNNIKGKRITISRYVDRMSINEKITCWIELDTYLQNCLENTHRLKSANIYGNESDDDYDSDDDDSSTGGDGERKYSTYHAIFMSKRISFSRDYEGQRIVVLCPQHKPHIRHGLWSRSASLCGNLAFGTMLSYIYTGSTVNKQAKRYCTMRGWRQKHFDYIIAEPNCFVLTSAVDSACPGGTFPVIPSHNDSSRKHFEWLWDHYLVHKPLARIFWIGHCEGCDDIKYLLSKRPTAAARTAGIVFMDYCIGSAQEELAAAPPPNDNSNVPPNPAFSRFFNGKTDNWLIKPIVISTQKYPNTSHYEWEKETRGNLLNVEQLSEAPVLLLYSVNINWRFTPCLSMYTINKYLLHRGIVDYEHIWKSEHERMKILRARNMQDNMAVGQPMQPSIVSSSAGSRQTADVYGHEMSIGMDQNATDEKKDMEPVYHSDTEIPDHLLPAAHEQGPIQMNTNENIQMRQQIYSQLPPTLVTFDNLKGKIVRDKQQKKIEEEANLKAFIDLQMKIAEKELNGEDEDGEDGDGKKKKKKKKKKDKKKDKKKKKKKKKGSDDEEEDDGGKKKKDKKKKKKKDKKKKKGKKKSKKED